MGGLIAVTFLDKIWELHVRLVVWRVEVHTIPAGGEHDFKSNTVGAIGVDVRFWSQVVVLACTFISRGVLMQAIEAQGHLTKSQLVHFGRTPLRLVSDIERLIHNERCLRRHSEIASTGIARDHAEVRWEGCHIRIVGFWRIVVEVVPVSAY